MGPVLHLVHLYPDLLNLYGDRGNIITLRRRCEWRGIDLAVHEIQSGRHNIPVLRRSIPLADGTVGGIRTVQCR